MGRLFASTGEPVDERGFHAGHYPTPHLPEKSGYPDCCGWDSHDIQLPPPRGSMQYVYADKVAATHAAIQAAPGFLVAAIDEHVPAKLQGSGYVGGHVTGRVLWFGKDAALKCQVPVNAKSGATVALDRSSDDPLASDLNRQLGTAIVDSLASLP